MLRPLLYYITDRRGFPGDEIAQHRKLLDKIEEATVAGVDYVQLREKDLGSGELEKLASDALDRIRNVKMRITNGEQETALLINSRTDVAIAIRAGGVHLLANDLSPTEVRNLLNSSAGPLARLAISVSCHTLEDVRKAESDKADLALFAPIFEKKDAPDTPAAGLDRLRAACRSGIPVLALGGVTLENAPACLHAGAAGIAAIRLFQENNIAELVGKLRP